MAWRKGKIYYLIGFVALVLSGAMVYAPYLGRLAQEGYPQLTWPALGTFAVIKQNKNFGNHRKKLIAKTSKLNRWSQKLFEEKGGKALLVFHKGKLVVEHYAKGFDRQSRFNSYSMVKSLVGVLTLKAVADKKIGRLSDPIGQYLPQIKNKKLAAIPIKNFLTMSSGIERSEPYQRQFLPHKLRNFYMGANISKASFHGVGRYGAQIYHNILDRKGQALQGKFTYMFGSRGQTVYMMPKKNLIVVRFGEKIQLLHSTLYAAWGMIEKNGSDL